MFGFGFLYIQQNKEILICLRIVVQFIFLCLPMDIFKNILIFSIVFSISACLINCGNALKTFNVLKYGALGNGITDDSQAFLKAWKDACNANGDEVPKMVIPTKKIFFVNPIIFQGPCKSRKITVAIRGKLVAPTRPSTWKGKDASLWLAFDHVSGLTVTGPGILDGRGTGWWKQSCRYYQGPGCTKLAPNVIKFLFCDQGQLNNIKIMNSPQTHVLLLGCNSFDISNVHIDSPESSPNTDGIHLSSAQHITIRHTNISAGDDCISIGDRTSHVNINTINCGPGHGISVGSLGIGGIEAQVEDIHVENVNFVKTTNGARIKTYQVGTGYARGITFRQLNFNSVDNPIIIDQYYCAVAGACGRTTSAVRVSNVTYEKAIGTSNTQVAINLNCSQAVPCSGLTFNTIQIKPAKVGGKLTTNCVNAKGSTIGVIQPDIPCL